MSKTRILKGNLFSRNSLITLPSVTGGYEMGSGEKMVEEGIEETIGGDIIILPGLALKISYLR